MGGKKTLTLLACVLIPSLTPSGIHAYEPFSLYSQARPPERPSFKTKVRPGEFSAAESHFCKNPWRIKNALRRNER